MKKSVIKRRKRASNTMTRGNDRSNESNNPPNGVKHLDYHGGPQIESRACDYSKLFTFKHHGPIVESGRHRADSYQDGMRLKSAVESANPRAFGEKRLQTYYADAESGKHRRISDSQVDLRPWSTSPLPERVQPSPVFTSYSLPSPTHISSTRDSHSMSPRRLSEERTVYMPPVTHPDPTNRHLPSLPPINITASSNAPSIFNDRRKQKDVDFLPPISEFGSSMLTGDCLTSSHKHNINHTPKSQWEMSPLKPILELSGDSNKNSISLDPTRLVAYHSHRGHSKDISIFSDPILHSLTSKPMRSQERNMGSTIMLAPIQNLFSVVD